LLKKEYQKNRLSGKGVLNFAFPYVELEAIEV